jgi:hypothetical protein
MQASIEPFWNDKTGPLFAQSYWIARDRRAATDATWIGCVQGYGIDLSSYSPTATEKTSPAQGIAPCH